MEKFTTTTGKDSRPRAQGARQINAGATIGPADGWRVACRSTRTVYARLDGPAASRWKRGYHPRRETRPACCGSLHAGGAVSGRFRGP